LRHAKVVVPGCLGLASDNILMLLRHLHLPGLTRYAHAAGIQESLVSAFLAQKANKTLIPPPPTILTFQFHPVYTCGRREANSLSAEQISFLRHRDPTSSEVADVADFEYAARGGQTTYHGPGQLVAYPVLDLRAHQLSSRCYVNLLEETVIATCARYGIRGFRTANPGVWVSEEEKICAVGVHLRRYIASHGIGLNVTGEPLGWFQRIVACGLEGKRATALEAASGSKIEGGADTVADVFVEEMASRLDGITEVISITEGELLSALSGSPGVSI